MTSELLNESCPISLGVLASGLGEDRKVVLMNACKIEHTDYSYN